MDSFFCEKDYYFLIRIEKRILIEKWMGRAKECELYKFTIKFDEMKEEAPVYREDLTVSEVAIETRKPTILFYLVFYLVAVEFLISRRDTLKKEKIVVGKVIVAKAIGIYILYIGRIRFVIN